MQGYLIILADHTMKRLYQNLLLPICVITLCLIVAPSKVRAAPGDGTTVKCATGCAQCIGTNVGGIVVQEGESTLICPTSGVAPDDCSCKIYTPPAEEVPDPLPGGEDDSSGKSTGGKGKDGVPLPGGGSSVGPHQILDFNDMITSAYSVVFPLAVGYGIFSLIKAGYMIKLSEGNPQKFKEAQDELVAAITGLLFILLSVGLLKIIITALL